MHRKPSNRGRCTLAGATVIRICVLMILASVFFVRAQISAEYQIKAVFLFRFTEFVEWPANAFASPQSPIVVGVLGSNPFGEALSQAVQGETVNGRRLEVRQFQQVREISSCHVLFISGSEAPRMPAILGALKGRSILTVSDTENFLAQGGMVQFITQAERVQFRINRVSAEAAKLKLSSKLLRLSQ